MRPGNRFNAWLEDLRRMALSPRKHLKKLAFSGFSLLDRAGVHVLPKHFYSPVPDYAWLRKNRKLWAGRSQMEGIDWNLDKQVEWLAEICKPYYTEVRGLEFYDRTVSHEWGLGYGAIESQVLHCVVRSLAPSRILEVGSGASTACMIHAVQRNAREGKPETQITCVEPFPRPAFKRLPNIRHIQELCQALPKSLFAELGPGDLLFIDSSHAVKTGSDVVKIYSELIPSLPAGVIVHIHDIFLPYLYPRDALTHLFGWQETVLLATLLTNNNHLSVLSCLSALHYDRTGELQSLLSDYQPQANDEGLHTDGSPAGSGLSGHFPASIWLRTS